MINTKILWLTDSGKARLLGVMLVMCTASRLFAAERPYVFTYAPEDVPEVLGFNFATRDDKLVFLAGTLECRGGQVGLVTRSFGLDVQFEGAKWTQHDSPWAGSQPSALMVAFYRSPYEKSMIVWFSKGELHRRVQEALAKRGTPKWVGELNVRLCIDIFNFDAGRRQFAVDQALASDPLILQWDGADFHVVAYSEESFLGTSTTLFKRLN